MTNRKGPSESATKFKKGTKRIGNDGNMWVIATTSSGTQRWQKINVLKKKNSTKKSFSTACHKGRLCLMVKTF